MNPHIPPKRKILELLGMGLLAIILFFVTNDINVIALFCFGFIWNWSASNELTMIFENRRYRMSMLKTVINLQNLILKPFAWAPVIVQRLVQALPAGIFWSIVIWINESAMPWWPTFVGSLAFELSQLDLILKKVPKEAP